MIDCNSEQQFEIAQAQRMLCYQLLHASKQSFLSNHPTLHVSQICMAVSTYDCHPADDKKENQM